jgi:hypothetical protein
MRTTGPTAGSAFAVRQIFMRLLNTLCPRFIFFRGFDLADPFVARQRRDIFPYRQGFGMSDERLFEIRGQFMHDAGGNLFRHYSTVMDFARLRG